ncbi:MAG: hypothetical protein GXO68_05790 [Crenarchaeota archaeon]|nr:hypothetical protein [Thermoproteota archaeon]
MPQEFYDALYIWVFLNLVDFITTKVGISRYGAREMNPIARLILERLGFLGLWTLKFIGVGILPLLIYLMGGDLEAALWTWNVILGAVVTNNSFQILRRRVKK